MILKKIWPHGFDKPSKSLVNGHGEHSVTLDHGNETDISTVNEHGGHSVTPDYGNDVSISTIKWIIIALVLFTFPFTMFCAPVDEKAKIKDGVRYGVTEGLFRAKWWNYYERGLSFASGAFWQDAENDLRAALKQRDVDQRRARTYGMHFIDYFPHRELGVVLLEMGRIPEAIDALERSLSTEESAKAKFYLNRARKSGLLADRVEDTTPPRIDLADGAVLTNALYFDVTASLFDENYVSHYAIDGVPGFLELGQQHLDVKKRISLISGKNEIAIEAEDLLGNRRRRILEVMADHLGPQLSVINFMDGETIYRSTAKITIAFMDDSGVERVTLGGNSLDGEGQKRGIHSATVSLQPGVNTIAMTAVDMAGNKTRGELQLILGSQSAGLDMPDDALPLPLSGRSFLTAMASMAVTSDMGHASDGGMMTAGMGHVLDEGMLTADMRHTLDERVLTVGMSHNTSDEMALAAVMTAGNDESQVVQDDHSPPTMMFRGLLRNVGNGERLTMTGRKKDNRFLIEGQVSDAGGVSSVRINDSEVVTGAMGKEVVFNRLVELTQGENRFFVTARDRSGNEQTKEVVIQREIQAIDMKESRISLSIMPFKNECISPTLAESVYSLFVDRVVNDERFNVVVRGEAFDAVLRELQLSQTDLVDNEKAVQAGRIVGSEGIMFGKIIETADAVEVYVHLTDTETARILASHDVYDQRKGRAEMEFLMQGLSSKFTYSMPLIEGRVLAAKGEKYFLDLGKIKHAKLQEGLKCIAYRSEPFIVDGMVLGEDITVLGTLLLKNVQEKISIAAVVSDSMGEGTGGITKEDRVMTK